MPTSDPTILEYIARTEAAETGFKRLIQTIRDLESELDTELDFDIAGLEKAVANIGELARTFRSVAEGVEFTKGELSQFGKSVSKIERDFSKAAKAVDEFAESAEEEFHPLIRAVVALRKELDSAVVAINKAETATDLANARAQVASLVKGYRDLGEEVEFSGADVKGLNEKYNSLGNAIRSALGIAKRELKEFRDTGADSAASVTERINALNRIFLELKTAVRPGQENKEAQQAYDLLKRKLDELAPSVVRLAKSAPEVAGSFLTLAGQVNSSSDRISRALKKISDDAEAAAAKDRRAKDQMAASAERSAKAAEAEAKRKEDANRRASKSTDDFSRKLTDLRQIVGAVVFSRIVQELYQFASASVRVSTELEALENAFNAVLGDGEGARALESLREEADVLGQSFLVVSENFLRFQVAGEAAKFTAEEIRGIYSSIIVAATAMNSSQEQLNRTVTAFEQIMSKGILSAEEIRRQMGNALPGAFSIVARALKVNNSQLEEMLRRGEVLSKEALPLIASELVKTFGPAAIANVASARAEFARVDNTLLKIRDRIGDEIKPLLLEFAREFNSLDTKQIDRVAERVGFTAFQFAELANIIKNIASGEPLDALGNAASFLGSAVAGTVSLLPELAAGFVGIFSDENAEPIRRHANAIRDGYREIVEEIKISIGATQSAGDVAVEYNQRARKAVEELQEAQEKAAKAARTQADGLGAFQKEVEEAEKAFAGLNNEIKLFGPFADFDIDADGDMLEFAKRLNEIKDRYALLIKFSPSLRAQIEAIEERMGSAAVATAKFEETLEDMGLEAPSSIKKSEDAFFDYLRVVERSGKVTSEQANVIVDAAEGIIDSIDALPESARAGFDSLRAQLTQTIDRYKEFTDEAIKEGEKLREETKKTFEGLAEEIRSVFEKVRESLRPDEDNALLENLDELQTEYDELRNKAVLSIEESNRFSELSGILAGARDNVSLLGAAFGAVNQDAAKAFQDMILNNDKLIEGLQLLGPAAQQSFFGLVDGFQQTLEAGNATENDLVGFGEAIASVFERAGVSMQGFRSGMDETLSLSQRLKAELADSQQAPLAPATDNSSVNNNVANSASQIADVYSTGTDAIQSFTDGQDRLTGSTEDLVSEQKALRAFLSAAPGLLKNNSASLRQVQEAGERFTAVQDELTKRNDEVVISMGGVSNAASSLESPLVAAAEASREMAEASQISGENLIDMIDRTNNVREGFEALKFPVKSTADGMAEISNTSETVNEGLQDLEQSFPKVGRAAEAITHDFGAATEAVAGLATNQDKFNASLLDTGSAASSAADATKSVGDSATEMAQRLEDATGPAVENVDKLEASASKLNGTLSQCFEILVKIATKMQEVGA